MPNSQSAVLFLQVTSQEVGGDGYTASKATATPPDGYRVRRFHESSPRNLTSIVLTSADSDTHMMGTPTDSGCTVTALGSGSNIPNMAGSVTRGPGPGEYPRSLHSRMRLHALLEED